MNETKSACAKAARELSMLTAKKVKPVPSGWFTQEQFQLEIGMHRESTREKLLQLKKSGLIEEKNWPHLDAKGRIYHKRIYRNI